MICDFNIFFNKIITPLIFPQYFHHFMCFLIIKNLIMLQEDGAEEATENVVALKFQHWSYHPLVKR